MKKVMIFFVAAATFSLISCSTDNDEENGSRGPWGAGYIPVYPGNYWVYEQYSIDTMGNETQLNHYDSIVITGTANVSGISYIVFEGSWNSGGPGIDTVLMLRDSSGYYVDPGGRVHFSYINFSDTLHSITMFSNHTGDTLYDAWYRMEQDPVLVTVPAGTFDCLNCRATVYTYEPNPGVPVYRYMDKLYARNVGVVLDTYYFLGNSKRIERRLARYHVSDLTYQ